MEMIFGILLLSCMGLSIGRQNLPPPRLKAFDEKVRINLILELVTALNKTVDEIVKESGNCERKMNHTTDNCVECEGNLPPQTQDVSAMDQVAAMLSIPIAQSQLLTRHMYGSSIMKNLIGNGMGNIADKLGIPGIDADLLNPNKLIDKLKKIDFSGIKDLANKAKDSLEKGWNKAKDSIGKGWNKAKGSIEKGWKSTKDWVKNVFGRRRRRSSCPDCEKLDSEDPDVIISNVCGSRYLKTIEKLQDKLDKVWKMYDAAAEKQVIIEVTTDNAKMDFETFSMTAEIVSVKYVVDGVTKALAFSGLRVPVDETMESAASKISPEVYKHYLA